MNSVPSDTMSNQTQKSSEQRKSAVALSYQPHDTAPRVVAKGNGELARRIIAAAKENHVYVHESPELLSLLMRLDLDSYIPPQLYLVIAELLAWLYHLEADCVRSNTSVQRGGLPASPE